MSKLLFAGTENRSPADERTQRSVPARRYSQLPPTHSITSAAPVLKVRVAGRITPIDFFVPSASCRLWLTHLPSKYTLARVVTLTPEKVSVVMGSRSGETRILGEQGHRPIRLHRAQQLNPLLGHVRTSRGDPHNPPDGPRPERPDPDPAP